MVWFRVDDGWHKHRKRIRTGLDLEGMAAQGLWAAAGSWASDELADGFIPDDVVDYLAPAIGRTLAKRLEAAKLWVRAEQDGEPGWQFHQWVEQQPTREEVEAASSKKSSGGKLGNHRRWHGEGGKFDPRCPFCREGVAPDDRSTDRISDRSTDRSSESGPIPPTRPDPTRPELPTEVKRPPSAARAVAQAEQPHFAGMPATEGLEPTSLQRAYGLARQWIACREEQRTPVVVSGRNGALHAVRSLIQPFVEADYSDAEIRAALDRIGQGLPSKQQLDKSLAQARTGTTNNEQGRRSGGLSGGNPRQLHDSHANPDRYKKTLRDTQESHGPRQG